MTPPAAVHDGGAGQPVPGRGVGVQPDTQPAGSDGRQFHRTRPDDPDGGGGGDGPQQPVPQRKVTDPGRVQVGGDGDLGERPVGSLRERGSVQRGRQIPAAEPQFVGGGW